MNIRKMSLSKIVPSIRDSVLLLGYCGFIFWLSHQPSLPLHISFSHQDKIQHAAAYGLMVMLCWRSFSHFLHNQVLLAGACLLFCAFFAVTDEWHQSFVPGRQMDLLDWLADILGASLALTSIVLIDRHKRRRRIELNRF